jgi:hypothetical protein
MPDYPTRSGITGRPPTPGKRSPGDAERLGDFRGAEALRLHFAHPGRVNRRTPPLVDARSLCLGGALKLALLAEIGFELREHAEHVEEAPAGGGAGIDQLLGRPP